MAHAIFSRSSTILFWSLVRDSCLPSFLARDELHRMLNEDELRDAILLVFANKKDLPNAMNAAEITDKIGLHSLRQRHWYIQSTCAISDEGLYEGLDWLSNNIANKA